MIRVEDRLEQFFPQSHPACSQLGVPFRGNREDVLGHVLDRCAQEPLAGGPGPPRELELRSPRGHGETPAQPDALVGSLIVLFPLEEVQRAPEQPFRPQGKIVGAKDLLRGLIALQNLHQTIVHTAVRTAPHQIEGILYLLSAECADHLHLVGDPTLSRRFRRDGTRRPRERECQRQQHAKRRQYLFPHFSTHSFPGASAPCSPSSPLPVRPAWESPKRRPRGVLAPASAARPSPSPNWRGSEFIFVRLYKQIIGLLQGIVKPGGASGIRGSSTLVLQPCREIVVEILS